MPKAFSKLSQIQYFTFESARISLKWTIKILLTTVTQRYRPELVFQSCMLQILIKSFHGVINKIHQQECEVLEVLGLTFWSRQRLGKLFHLSRTELLVC